VPSSRGLWNLCEKRICSVLRGTLPGCRVRDRIPAIRMALSMGSIFVSAWTVAIRVAAFSGVRVVIER